MENNNCKGCFGLSQAYFRAKDNKIKKTDYAKPYDIQAYRGRIDSNRIIKNLIMYNDNVCGATIMYEKEFCVEYMNKIKDYVVYVEDIFQVIAAIEGNPLVLYDDNLIWYEVGDGVSTKKHSKY
jgi:hypothetical protein